MSEKIKWKRSLSQCRLGLPHCVNGAALCLAILLAATLQHQNVFCWHPHIAIAVAASRPSILQSAAAAQVLLVDVVSHAQAPRVMSRNTKPLFLGQQKAVDVAQVPLVDMVNHAQTPNAKVWRRGGWARMVALQPIRTGEEVP